MGDSSGTKKKQVAIFGGGIAGLTAAHELIERGFDVEVYEQVRPSVRDRVLGVPCGLGGMARTQWARVERGTSGGSQTMTSTEPLFLLLDEPAELNRDEPRLQILFQNGGDDFTNAAEAAATLDKVVALLKEAVSGGVGLHQVEVRGHSRVREDFPLSDNTSVARKRAVKVAEELQRRLKAVGLTTITPVPANFGLGYPLDWRKPDNKRDYVSFHVVEDWIPGEHGFRFFPSFYRNLFDTMRRTPIPDPNEPVYQETPRTTLDNVVPTEFMGLSTLSSKPAFAFHRRPSLSLQELFDQLCGMLAAMGCSLSDLNRFHLKLFKYMTSCAERREEYEAISWWDFLQADQFSPAFQRYLNAGAETLLAMNARTCDARTYGSFSVQMIQNQLAGLPRTDGTLNGPTSLVWFDPWRRYLAEQGVRFVRGELKSLELFEGHTAWARVAIHHRGPKAEEEKVNTLLVRDYYVLALAPHELQAVVAHSPTLQGDDFERIARFPLGDPTKAETGGALDHMSGIQFYFNSDFKFIEGHTIFPDSKWRLSAIFQPQFWTQKRGWWSGYRGVLSVDISNWHSETDPAWESPKDKIASEVWDQIKEALQERANAPGRTPPAVVLPEVLFFHLDGNIRFKRSSSLGWLPSENRTPYLLSRPGEQALRPGTPGKYTVHPGGIVIAGVLMQTCTRLTTMEAANESARHAVNAILKAEGFQGECCATFNLEDYEPPDLKFLVEIDARLHKLKLPHFVDILDLRELPHELLRPDPDLSALGLERWGIHL